jgi:hypothetical protein
MDFDRLEDLEDTGPDWSISRLQTIMQCGKKYEFKYITKTKEAPTPPLAFGSAIHRCIDTMHLKSVWSDAQMQRLWSDTWYECQKDIDWTKTQYRKNTQEAKGIKILETYRAKHINDEWHGLELNFRFLTPAQPDGWDMPAVRGTWDKVMRLKKFEDMPDKYIGRLAIIDYKTSKTPPEQLMVDVDPQLTIYHRAARELLGEDVVLGLHHLPTDKIFWTTRTDQSMNVVLKMMREAEERLYYMKFDRNIDFHCKWCPFKEQCLGGLLSGTAD